VRNSLQSSSSLDLNLRSSLIAALNQKVLSSVVIIPYLGVGLIVLIVLLDYKVEVVTSLLLTFIHFEINYNLA
jgi:hypothetical protein